MKRRVLVVEDEPEVRALVGEVLALSGFEVAAAGSGEAARGLLEGTGPPFDLAVVDVHLPDLRGEEVGRLVERRCPGARVLFVTGHWEGWTRKTGLPPGAAVLRKPFTPAELGAAVERLLGPS